MDPIEKKKDPARPSREDAHERTTAERSSHDRINKIADQAANKGRREQRKDEEGNDEFSNVGPS